MRPISQLVLLMFTAGSAGCAFVSDVEKQGLLDNVDADEDGVPAPFDCDDTDPARRPGTVADLLPWYYGDQVPSSADWEDPTWVDVAYDGIDNNCSSEDMINVDGDRYAGVDKEEYLARVVAAGLYPDTESVPWPQELFVGVDCDDNDPLMFPGAADQIYDGIDSDCGADNDYDRDRDGQMPRTFADADDVERDTAEAVAAYLHRYPSIQIDVNAADAFGDCRDDDDQIYSGAPGDIWYDGVDTNCDGLNDFDADGDGYMPDGYASLFSDFLRTYHPSTPVSGPSTWGPGGHGVALGGDCLDKPHVHHLPVDAWDPAMVNPGVAPDVTDDGVDSDCDGSNDFDSDGDGSIPDSEVAAFEQYVIDWHGDGTPDFPNTLLETTTVSGDCNDSDATVGPGSLELFFDAIDSDCDGDPDSTKWGFGNYLWDRPSWPRIVRTNDSYAFVMMAEESVQLKVPTPVFHLDAALELTFALDSGYDAIPEDAPNVWTESQGVDWEYGAGVDAVGSGSEIYMVSSYEPNNSTAVRSGGYTISMDDHQSGEKTRGVRHFEYTGVGADIDIIYHEPTPGDRWIWGVGCGGAGRTAVGAAPVDGVPGYVFAFGRTVPILGTDTWNDFGGFDQWVSTNHSAASACFVTLDDDARGLFHVCDSVGCLTYTEGTDSSGTNPYPLEEQLHSVYENRQLVEADNHAGLVVLVDAAGVEIQDIAAQSSYNLFAGEPVVSADAMWRGSVLFAIAIVEDTPVNRVVLTWGDPTDPAHMESMPLPLADDDERLHHLNDAADCVDLAHWPELSYNHPPAPPDILSVKPEQCPSGRTLDPRKVSLHVDNDRLVLAVSSMSLDVPLWPFNKIKNPYSPAPFSQDAVSWMFMGFDDLAQPL